ncbi:hypothetical protein HY837_02290 [archaeon]|nr:hypothetical protein [archaeon]
MRKTTVCALVASLFFTQSCALLKNQQNTSEETETVSLNNGYTTERSALNLLYSEAKKLEGTTVKTKSGIHEVENARESIYRLCEMADGIFSYEDSDYYVSLKELKEYSRRKK